jgi:hypothetical protein
MFAPRTARPLTPLVTTQSAPRCRLRSDVVVVLGRSTTLPFSCLVSWGWAVDVRDQLSAHQGLTPSKTEALAALLPRREVPPAVTTFRSPSHTWASLVPRLPEIFSFHQTSARSVHGRSARPADALMVLVAALYKSAGFPGGGTFFQSAPERVSCPLRCLCLCISVLPTDFFAMYSTAARPALDRL